MSTWTQYNICPNGFVYSLSLPTIDVCTKIHHSVPFALCVRLWFRLFCQPNAIDSISNQQCLCELQWGWCGSCRFFVGALFCSSSLFCSVLFSLTECELCLMQFLFFLSSVVVPDAVYFVYRDIMRYITETFCGYLREISSVIYGLGLIRVIENGRRCLSRCCRSLLLQNFTVLNKSKLY